MSAFTRTYEPDMKTAMVREIAVALALVAAFARCGHRTDRLTQRR